MLDEVGTRSESESKLSHSKKENDEHGAQENRSAV